MGGFLQNNQMVYVLYLGKETYHKKGKSCGLHSTGSDRDRKNGL